MANLTSILGSSQLGLMELGAGPAATEITVESTSTVSQTIVVARDYGPSWGFATSSITVGSTIGVHLERSIATTTSVTVTSTPWIETTGRVTQLAIDVVYNRNLLQVVTDSITVSSQPHVFYPARVTHLAVDVVYRKPPDIPVSSDVTVTPTIAHRSNQPRIGVTSSIVVGATIRGSGDIQRRTVTSTVTVAGTAQPVNQHLLIVVPSSVVVGQTVVNSVNPLKALITSFINVASILGGGPADRIVSMTSTVTVTQTVNPHRPQLAVTQSITVDSNFGGGGPIRNEFPSHGIGVGQTIVARTNNIYQSVSHSIAVSHTREGRGPIVRIAVTSPVTVGTTQIPRGPKRITVVSSVGATSGDQRRATNVRDFSFSDVVVAQKIHSNLVYLPVAHTIVVTPRISHHELTVVSRIIVNSSASRVIPIEMSSSVGVTQTVGRQVVFLRNTIDSPSIVDTTARVLEINREFTDLVIFPADFFTRTIFTLDQISVPVAVGTLVSQYTLLQSSSDALVLPPPQFGDEKTNTDAITIHRAMSGEALAFKIESERQRLRLLFRVDKIKALETRRFIQRNLSNRIDLTTHTGEKWIVVFPEAPISIQYAGRAGNASEFATVELLMDGQKISG